MRRLLIAAAFPFSTLLPAQGGDLGIYDHGLAGVDARGSKSGVKQFETLAGLSIEFKDGRMISGFPESLANTMKERGMIPKDAVLSNKGIVPSQVISYSQHVQKPYIVFQVFYKDSSERGSLASIIFANQNTAVSFNRSFLEWYSGKAEQ